VLNTHVKLTDDATKASVAAARQLTRISKLGSFRADW